jgi:hypothetical protein
MANFRTLKPQRAAVIVQQPIVYYQRNSKGKTTKKRHIQYVEDLETIFVDEQRKLVDNPKPSPIYIAKGVLKIDDDNLPMLELMSKHPHNQANGGTLFRLVDVEKDDLYEVKQSEKIDKARASLIDMDDNLIRAVAAWFLGHSFISKSILKLKKTLRSKLEMNFKLTDGKTFFVDAFTEFIEEKNNEEKLMVMLAIQKGIITIINGKTVAWGNSDEPIYNGSQPNYIVREFSVWVKNDEEGRNVLKLIAEKISNLK